MRICVIGAGYVGLVTAACFAEMGNRVRCVERDPARLAQLRRGESPIHEPGPRLLAQHLESGQLDFTARLAEGLEQADVAFIAVGTPSGEDGSADLSHVLAVADELGRVLQRPCLVVDKSTVPVGTAERVAACINGRLAARGKAFRIQVASNPEFLKEGLPLTTSCAPIASSSAPTTRQPANCCGASTRRSRATTTASSAWAPAPRSSPSTLPTPSSPRASPS